jgi:hypothetical protein
MQLIMWTTFGLVFGILAERALTVGRGHETFMRKIGVSYRT